jgi:two-component system copper resistance phosphate regulon response regulator CusR
MKILIVEDEPNVVSVLTRGLNSEGFETSVAPDGVVALEMISAHNFDLIVMDIMLPGINGIDLCKQVKSKNPHIPVIMLTALGTTENIVTGLDNGADDYLVKPFKIAELSARIRTILRRFSGNQPNDEIISIGNLHLNIQAKTVIRGEKEITLTATEYRLLQFFAKNKNKTLSRIDILENVWDIDFNMGTNVVDVYVNYLRKKIDKGFESNLIHTIVGLGYMLKEKTAG